MARVDDKRVEDIRKSGEFWPGGDIRVLGNQWMRAAFQSSGLKKAPRENSIRQALHKIIRKKKLRLHLSETVHVCVTLCMRVCYAMNMYYLIKEVFLHCKGGGRTDDEIDSWVMQQETCYLSIFRAYFMF